MLPEWNRDLLWSEHDARARRRRSLHRVMLLISLGIGLGVANQACYELLQRADRPAAELVKTVPAHGLR